MDSFRRLGKRGSGEDPDTARASATIIYSANRLAHRYGFGCELDAEAPALYNTTKHFLLM